MREIKFKFVVKTNDNIEVTEAYDLCDLMEWVNVLSEYSADEILHELQYTGLKDKNGIEIYEGDIITIGNYTHIVEIKDDLRILLKVIPHLSLRDYRDMYHYEFQDNIVFEVIGNIYENKDLL